MTERVTATRPSAPSASVKLFDLPSRLRTRRWARARLRRHDAVILDTETTDLFGSVVQLSVIDLRGRPLLNTLIHTADPITPEATAVHGIRTGDLVDAPTLGEVAPQLLELTRGRHVLAYNAPYDRAVLTRDLPAAGVDPEHLASPATWTCLMRARARVERSSWTALAGPHHALGDCLAALEVLHRIAGRRS